MWPNGKFVTANIIVRTDYLRDNPEIIKKLLEAHVDETLWINNNTAVAEKEFNAQLKKITGQEINPDILNKSYSNLEITYDPLKLTLYKSANDAYDLGFIEKGKDRPSLSGIYDTAILNQVLLEKGLEPLDDTGTINNAMNSTDSEGVIADMVV